MRSSQLAAQEQKVPYSQRTTKRRRTTTPADRRTPGKDEWDPKLLREYNNYMQAPMQTDRQTMWRRWTTNEKRLVYMFSRTSFREEHSQWKTVALEEESLGSSSWQHDLTQDGDVEAHPGPRHRYVNKEGGNATRGERDIGEGTRRRRREKRQPWPRPLARQARASRATPENRAQTVLNSYSEGRRGCNPCPHCGQNIVNSNVNSCRRPGPVNDGDSRRNLRRQASAVNSVVQPVAHRKYATYSDAVRCGHLEKSRVNSHRQSHSREPARPPTNSRPCGCVRVRASRGSERGHGRHLDVDPPGEPRRSLSQRNTRPFRDKVRAPGGSEMGHGRHLDVDSPGELWRKPPHSADSHRLRREYVRSRPLVQGSVKQGKSRSAPCTSHKVRKPVRPRNNKQKKDQGHSANVCVCLCVCENCGYGLR